MANSMKIMEQSMKTLGKPMNTIMVKQAKTMEESMNSANGAF